jgi:hypothetical protein
MASESITHIDEQNDYNKSELLGTIKDIIATFFSTILIILIWICMMIVLIRKDVNGFGSEVLAPILYDTKVNWILPTGSIEEQEFKAEYRKEYPKDYSKRPKGSVETLEEARVYVEDLQDYCEQLENENDTLKQQLFELEKK